MISLGPVLRHLGKGRCVLTLRQKEAMLRVATDGKGNQLPYPGDVHTTIQVDDFRELENDIWELTCRERVGEDFKALLVYVHGTDILTVRALPQISRLTAA